MSAPAELGEFLEVSAGERVRRARAQLVIGQPFYGCLAIPLELIPSTRIEGAAINNKALYFNPAWIETLSEAEVVGMWAHEVAHLARLHHVRRGSRDLARWNRACDLTINPDLRVEGFTLPSDLLDGSEYVGMNAEAVYAALAAEEEPQDGQDGQPGPSGAGEPSAAPGEPEEGQDGPDAAEAPDPGGCGGILDADLSDGSTLDEVEADQEMRVRQAATAAIRQAGEVPGSVSRTLGELDTPRISWREVLARFVDDAANRATCWNRPDRRFLQSGFYLPGKTADAVGKVVCVVDDSGSISDRIVQAFGGEAAGILASGKVASIEVIYADTRVHKADSFVLGDVVKIDPGNAGGGGTAFDQALSHVEAEHPDAACVVYLTDLDVSASRIGRDPGMPVLWLAWGPERSWTVPAFGEVVKLDPYQ